MEVLELIITRAFWLGGARVRAPDRARLASDLPDYDQTKSSLHFDPGQPLPPALVRKLIKACIAEAA